MQEIRGAAALILRQIPCTGRKWDINCPARHDSVDVDVFDVSCNDADRRVDSPNVVLICSQTRRFKQRRLVSAEDEEGEAFG